MKAAVYDGAELRVVENMTVRDPGPGEVLVRVRAAGLCHSDLSILTGTIPYPVPVVPGHEGAGVVEAVGSGVAHVAVGDHVALSTLTNCGMCAECSTGRPTMCRKTFGVRPTPFDWDGTPTYSYAATSVFSEYTVVQAVQVVPIPKDLPFNSACLIGCGVLTGVGAVLNRAKVGLGETVAVIGAGGIGLNVIQGARLARAGRIIAIDANPDKEKAAKQFGATDFVNAKETDAVAAVKELTGGGGVDHAFECVGTSKLERQAVDMLDWHGQAILLGVPAADDELSVPVVSLYLDKSILGCRYGSSRPAADINRYVGLYQSGELMLDELVSRTYPLDRIDEAIEDLEHGRVNRGVFAL